MSIKYGLLAALQDGPAHGVVLRDRFTERTGGMWPVNPGQVYSTLGRLAADGLVAQDGPDDLRRVVYHLTPAGQDALHQWWFTPVLRTGTPRDEVLVLVALALAAPGVDVAQVVALQRHAATAHLHELVLRKKELLALGSMRSQREESELLVLEQSVYAAEVAVRWLTYVADQVAAGWVTTPESAHKVLTVLKAGEGVA